MGNQLEYEAVIPCIKIVLFLFNMLFWFLSLLFMTVGVCAVFYVSNYIEMTPEFSETASYVFIGIGMLLFITSLFAFSCIIKTQPVLLYLYGGFLACITMMSIGMIATLACFRHTFAKALYNELNQAVINYSQIKTNLDLAQITMHCCGVHNYTDWFRMTTHRVIPYSCCQDRHNCVTANYSDIFQKGCYHAIMDAMEANKEMFAFFVAATTILPTCGTILACVLANYANKLKYDVME